MAFVAEAEAKISSSISSSRPANRDKPSWMKPHFCSVVSPGAMLVVAIAPKLTIGLVLPSGRSSIAATELNFLPVALRPTKLGNRVRGVDAAHQREHKGLRHAHDRELHVRITSLGSKSSSIGHADAEPVGIDRGERGVHV